ncbi:MAG: uroporphyrinogen decarboxylase [Gammaproteobacteria bacterium]|nr:uroporphyrinogen decarboxylase [Gammaproteobacteria bacterium]
MAVDLNQNQNIQNPELKNNLFIKALLRQPVDRTPVWVMRQAGRYLPEYRKLRERAGDFMTLCKTPELACEATMQPLARFELDAAILFSDILTIPDAMGLGLSFIKDEGPVFSKPVRSKQDVNNLIIPEPSTDLNYVIQAVKSIKSELKNSIPLIGFSGSPWTLATYMVEGGSSKTFAKVKAFAYQEPEVFKLLLEKLAKSIEYYLIAQIEAGVNACMIFDTWGGILTPEGYQEFSLDYMGKIVNNIKNYLKLKNKIIPIILFTKQGGQWIEKIANTGCDAVGLDWTMNIKVARELVGHKVALQGNLDPAILYAEPKVITREVEKILNDFGPHYGHVFNLGHGITPDVNPEHLQAMIAAVREVSTKIHKNSQKLNY